MEGLEWLARVGPSPLDPWRYAMGWSEVAAGVTPDGSSAKDGCERCPMVRGQGSLFLATRKGVLVLGLPLIAATTPAPTWWAHDSGCAWTAAWLTVRGRRYFGPRELLDDPEWSGQLTGWIVTASSGPRTGRTWSASWATDGFAIEVELAPKSKPRLDAILKLHLAWVRRATRRAASSTSAATRRARGGSSERVNASALSERQVAAN